MVRRNTVLGASVVSAILTVSVWTNGMSWRNRENRLKGKEVLAGVSCVDLNKGSVKFKSGETVLSGQSFKTGEGSQVKVDIGVAIQEPSAKRAKPVVRLTDSFSGTIGEGIVHVCESPIN